jgi:hypothetical protein
MSSGEGDVIVNTHWEENEFFVNTEGFLGETVLPGGTPQCYA